VKDAELLLRVEKRGSSRNRQALDKFFAPLDILPLDEGAMRSDGSPPRGCEGRGSDGASSGARSYTSPRHETRLQVLRDPSAVTSTGRIIRYCVQIVSTSSALSEPNRPMIAAY